MKSYNRKVFGKEVSLYYFVSVLIVTFVAMFLIAFFTDSEFYILILIGAFVGLFSVRKKDEKSFILSSIAIIIISLIVLFLFGEILYVWAVFTIILYLFLPALIVVLVEDLIKLLKK